MLFKILFLFAIAIKQNQMTDVPLQRALKNECIINFTVRGIFFNRGNTNKIETWHKVSWSRLQNKIRYAVFCGDTSGYDKNTANKKFNSELAYLTVNNLSFWCKFEDASPEGSFENFIIMKYGTEYLKTKIYPIETHLVRSNKLKVNDKICDKDPKHYTHYLWPTSRYENGKQKNDQIVFLFRNSPSFNVDNNNENTDLYIRLNIKKTEEPKKVLVKKTKKL